MTDIFQKYLTELYKDVPFGMYEVLLYILCIGVVLVLTIKGIRKGWRLVSRLVLVEYVVLLFFTTVFSRNYSDAPRFNITPFWSYIEIINGKRSLIPENIMNVAVFVLVGVLLGLSFSELKWKGVIFFAVCVSLSIEILQFIFHRGFSELDDVLHNTLGCIIGYGLYRLTNGLYRCLAQGKVVKEL